MEKKANNEITKITSSSGIYKAFYHNFSNFSSLGLFGKKHNHKVLKFD